MSDSSSVYRYSKVEHALLRQAWISEGRSDAYAFAVKVQADASRILAEIESEEISIREALANSSIGRNNPMAPGASPRIYRDAYIAGLREALALIHELSELSDVEPL